MYVHIENISFRSYYVSIDDIISEKFIHENLKNKNLHIEFINIIKRMIFIFMFNN